MVSTGYPLHIRIDLFYQDVDRIFEILVFPDIRFDFFDPMDDGRMIPPAENVADILQGTIRHFLAQIHGNLPRISDVLAFLFGYHIVHGQAVMLCDGLDDQLRRDLFGTIRRDQVFQRFFRKDKVDRLPFQIGKENDLV